MYLDTDTQLFDDSIKFSKTQNLNLEFQMISKIKNHGKVKSYNLDSLIKKRSSLLKTVSRNDMNKSHDIGLNTITPILRNKNLIRIDETTQDETRAEDVNSRYKSIQNSSMALNDIR